MAISMWRIQNNRYLVCAPKNAVKQNTLLIYYIIKFDIKIYEPTTTNK